MTLKDVQFKFRHRGCILQRAAEAHPGAVLTLSSIYQFEKTIFADLTVQATSRKGLQAIHDVLRGDKKFERVEKLSEAEGAARFQLVYNANDSLYQTIVSHKPLFWGPVRIVGGAEFYHMMIEAAGFDALLADLNRQGKADVLVVRNADSEASAGPRGPIDLNERQWRALVAAVEHGYYDWPRGMSPSKIAKRMRLSRSHFLRLLRKAERDVIQSFMDGIARSDPARLELARQQIAMVGGDGDDEAPPG